MNVRKIKCCLCLLQFLSNMGWLDSLITGIFGVGQQSAGMAFDANQAKKNREFQSQEAELNRAFQSNEAALQRDWSSQEAEQARDWQEEMYAKYNSLSGKIAQAEQAGVNPLFAVTGNAVTPMSAYASSPSGASAGSVGTPAGSAASAGLLNILGAVLDARKVESEIDLNKSEAERNRADAEKTGKETAWIDKLSQAQLENIAADTDELASRLGVNSETANKLKAEFSKLAQETARISQITSSEKRNLEAQAALAEWQTENNGLFKSLDLGSDVLNTILDFAVALIEKKTKTTIVR